MDLIEINRAVEKDIMEIESEGKEEGVVPLGRRSIKSSLTTASLSGRWVPGMSRGFHLGTASP